MRTDNITLIGLGKLGLPLLVTFAKHGQSIIGIDIDKEKINMLKNKEIPFFEKNMRKYLEEGYDNISWSYTFDDVVEQSDVYIILVNTPSTENGDFSNVYIFDALTELCARINKTEKKDFLIILSSTVMPGSCDKFVQFIETSTDRKLNDDFGVIHIPDLVALGTVIHDFENPDVTIIGQSNERYGAIAEQIYSQIIKNNSPIVRMSLLESEISKVSLNAFVTMKISFFNFIGNICDEYQSDPRNISKALGFDRRISPYYSKSGLAFGGTCFPRDTWAFIKMADQLGLDAIHIKAIQKINEEQNNILFDKVSVYSDKKIGVLGLSFKPGTSVITESPGNILYKRLKSSGYDVYGFDPIVDTDYQDLEKFVKVCDIIVVTHVFDWFKDIDIADKIIIDPWRCLIAN